MRGVRRIALASALAVVAMSVGRMAIASSAPAVTAVSPGMLSANGGTVALSGSGLAAADTVVLGRLTVTAHPCVLPSSTQCFTANSDNALTVQLGPADTGTVDVVAHAGGAASATSAADELTLTAPMPVVTSLDPAQGWLLGGQTVTIHGSGLTPRGGAPIEVYFGSLRVGASANSDGTVSVITPPAPSGAQPVRVVTLSDDGSVGQASAPRGPLFNFSSSARGPSGTTMNAFGGDGTVGSSAVSDAIWPGWPIAKDLDVTNAGGYLLDGFGGLHPLHGARPVADGSFSPGWDIARAIAVRADSGSGYVLDGWGGVHPFGGAPAVVYSGYWPGWDIARDIVLRPDGGSGYVLDGYGGVHPFGPPNNLPAPLAVTGYWNGWDIAHRLVLNRGGDGGYVLDGFGGLRPFGNQAPTTVSAYWGGWDIARDVSFLPGSSSQGYVLDGWGAVHGFGGAPPLASPTTPGQDLWRSLSLG